MLVYLSGVQIFLMSFIYLIPASNAAAIICSVLIWAFALSSGYTVHFKDLPVYTKWLEYISPTSWLLPFLLNRELSQEAVASSSATTLCRNKQVKRISSYLTIINNEQNNKNIIVRCSIRILSFNYRVRLRTGLTHCPSTAICSPSKNSPPMEMPPSLFSFFTQFSSSWLVSLSFSVAAETTENHTRE